MAEESRLVRVGLDAGRGYDVEIGAGSLSRLGKTARRALSSKARRVALITNARVFNLYGARAVESLRGEGFPVAHWLMGDGERHKTLRTAERALLFLSESEIERSDAVIALGGGVVGDLAGLAAALHLRGVPVIHAPTTLLAQVDASVGGKTAVNTRAGKNLAGAFHQPRAVLIDTDTLETLPARELTSGWCEAVKQGAAGDLKLFEKTRAFLTEEKLFAGGKGAGATVKRRRGDDGADAAAERRRKLVELIAAQCAFKAGIVAGDEREGIDRTDARSRRILNFGHTVAHALESVTRFRRFRHGEAVGWGMLAAAEISFRLGMLEQTELELLRDTVRLAGKLPRADDLDRELVRRATHTDKKRIGGRVLWVLLEGIGCARVVDGREIPTRVVRAALAAALRRDT